MHRRQFAFSCAATLVPFLTCYADEGEAIAGETWRLTDPGWGDNRASYMPDGKSLLFASNRTGMSQIWTMQPDGLKMRRLLMSEANDYGRVAPSSDGTRLCFSSDRSGENAIYVMDLGSGAVSSISDPGWWSYGPTWSARDLIAYFSRKGGNRLNIWTVRPDGSQARQMTERPGDSRQPWWSPDGATLALSADGGTGSSQIWLTAADGLAARAVTTRGDWQQPVWSPDSRRLAVSVKVDAPCFRIMVIDLDGSSIRPIQQPEAVDNVHPIWSPDGASIVFSSGIEKSGALWKFAFA